MTMTNFMAVTAILSLLLLMLFDMTRKKELFRCRKGTFVRDAWYITDYNLPTLLISCSLKSNA